MSLRWEETLRSAFAARTRPVGSSDNCPSAELHWEGAAGRLNSSQMEALFEHHVHCATCAEVWRLAVTMREDEDGAVVLPTRPLRGPRRLLIGGAVGLAAAAAMLLVFIPPQGQDVWRDGEPDASEHLPQRSLNREAPEVFWEEGPPGATYDFLLLDADGRVVLEAEGLKAPRWTVPTDVLEPFPDGATFFQEVVVYTPEFPSETRPTVILDLR